MSGGFLLQNAADAVIWRGPMKFGVIRQFLKDVEWGPLDFLVIAQAIKGLLVWGGQP